MERRARIAAAAGLAGGLGMIIGSFGDWAQSGSITVSGLGGISEPALYPELEGVFAPGWLTLALGIAALGALVAVGAFGATVGGIALDAAGVGGLAVAIISVVDITSIGGFGADPTWGVFAVGAGGLLASFGGTLLMFSGRDALASSPGGLGAR